MDIRRIREQLRQGETIFNLPLRVTFYARVSTDKEEQQSSLENQVDYYTSYIKERSAWTFIPGYVDEGVSGGSTKKRDSFNRMIEDARIGLFDIIITKEISRFSRNTLESIQYTRELLDMGVCVIFQNDGINTLDTDSEFRLVIMAGVAQDEIRKLSERLKFGFRQSIHNGRVLGNNKLYGYDKKDCKLVINEEQAEVVRTIFDQYANHNIGFRKIAQYVSDNLGARSYQGNQFNTKTVQNILRNPKYKGYYCANKTRSVDYRTHKNEKIDPSEWIVYKDDAIPAIVSEELWDRANKILKMRCAKAQGYEATYNNRYPYSGKLVCAEHGTSFHRVSHKTQDGQQERWQCKVYKYRGKAACSAPILRTSELNAVMAEIFSSQGFDKASLIEKTMALIKSSPDGKNYAAELETIRRELEEIARRKDKILDMSMDDIISTKEFKERNDKLNSQVNQLQVRESELETEQAKGEQAVANLDKIKRVLEKELFFEDGIRSELVTTILDKIIVHNTGKENFVKLEIHLKIGAIIPYSFSRNMLPSCGNTSKSTTRTPETKRI